MSNPIRRSAEAGSAYGPQFAESREINRKVADFSAIGLFRTSIHEQFHGVARKFTVRSGVRPLCETGELVAGWAWGVVGGGPGLVVCLGRANRKRARPQRRLVAFCTGSDGSYKVRLTTGPLTPEETSRVCLPGAFPLVVRHGRVLLDNTDALPGLEQMIDPEATDSWYELPNGAYRTTVHPIDQNSEATRALP